MPGSVLIPGVHQRPPTVFSGPSGSGKTTIVRRVLRLVSELRLSISYTTRAIRDGEINGLHYIFVTKEEFLEMRDAGYFLEWAEVHGNFYGTSREWVKHEVALGTPVALEIDCKGAEQVRRIARDALTFFIMPPPPPLETLRSRLVHRGTDSAEVIEERIRDAAEQIEQAPLFTHIVVNDDVERAVQDIVRIIRDRFAA